MKTRTFARRALLFLILGSSLIATAACRTNATPTAVPITSATAAAGSTLPPAPTAAPLTAVPTDVPTAAPPTVAQATATQVVIPTVTPIAPALTSTAPQTGGGSIQPRPAGGVYVTRLRMDPATARNKENVTFYATLLNTTGKDVNTTWCVEIYRPGDKKSFGITRCDLKTIPTGTSEQITTGWEIAGVRECIPAMARVVVRDELDVRTPLPTGTGKDLWLAFDACP